MKHIQVVDGAENCSYSICLVSDRDFRTIFPRKGQDIEFAEDLAKRVGNKRAGQIIIRSTTRRLRKHSVQGIHRTLFFGLKNRRKHTQRSETRISRCLVSSKSYQPNRVTQAALRRYRDAASAPLTPCLSSGDRGLRRREEGRAVCRVTAVGAGLCHVLARTPWE
jgi:hypothetical protein